MLEWMHDEDITKNLQIDGKSKTMEDCLAFIEASKEESVNLHRAIADDDDVYCGTVSLKNIDRNKNDAEYAIALHRDAIGKGAARQATLLIRDVAYDELGLESVYLYVYESNQRAVRYYKKNNDIFMQTHGEETKDESGKHRIWFRLTRGERTEKQG